MRHVIRDPHKVWKLCLCVHVHMCLVDFAGNVLLQLSCKADRRAEDDAPADLTGLKLKSI